MRLIFLASLFAYFISQWKSPNEEKFLSKCLYPTVTIINPKKSVTGTGVIVKSKKINDNQYCNIVFSCEHVINNRVQVAEHIYEEIYFNNKISRRNAYTLAKNEEFDISILIFLSDKQMPVADVIYDNYFKLRDEVFLIGCGLSGSPRFSDGKVTDMATNRKNLHYIGSSVSMVPGDSGGPLFNKDYKVVAIANAIKTTDHNGINIPITNISFFKPTQLFPKCFSKDEFDFVYSNDNFPPIIMDYLWLLATEYQH